MSSKIPQWATDFSDGSPTDSFPIRGTAEPSVGNFSPFIPLCSSPFLSVSPGSPGIESLQRGRAYQFGCPFESLRVLSPSQGGYASLEIRDRDVEGLQLFRRHFTGCAR